jgi:serine/threonine protein kinase/lambda repressor-like predicted transcriptional regulator
VNELTSDPDVLLLVRQERLLEAAELSASRGDAKTASELYEKACAFKEAAFEALRATLPERGLALAAEAGDEGLALDAVRRILAKNERPSAQRVALLLERRGHHLWAARVYEGLGETRQAARAFEEGGDAVRAATLLESGGEPALASTVLESAARLEPDRFEVLVALGGLLLRYGKTEAAVRALQRIPDDSPHRRAALTYLVPALDRLGLPDASAEAARALDSEGGPLDGFTLAAPTAEAKTRLFGRYEVVREVASTPSARVLLCTDAVRGEKVAVKVFAAYDSRGAGRDALARFEREVRALGALEHPNVVPLRDYLPEGPALVLAWMGGGTLEERIAQGNITPDRAVEIACSVLVALGEAHRLGILHRDIKPANVLFDDSGTARLADFGVAHLSDASATATAGVFGTLAYMSPEQREGRPATLESDLFGVGVLLLEMLTGDKPGPGRGPRTLPSAAHRDLDARHDAVVLRFLEEEPIRRPKGAFAARRELQSLPWPKDIQPAPFAGPKSRKSSSPPSARPAGETEASDESQPGRLDHSGGDDVLDTWLGRRVVRVPWTPEVIARASAFARAAHPRLQSVLRADRDDHSIWLEAPRGRPVSRPLDEVELGQARAALEALHAVDVVHGNLDAKHLYLGDEGVTVLFSATADPLATFDLDSIALARLGRVVR